MDDDWLDEPQSGPTQGGAQDPLVDRHWERLTTRYSDAGYREGITPGKLSTLQQGFDTAFAASVAPSRQLGQLRGRAASLLAYLIAIDDSTQIPDVRALIQRLGRVKRDDVLPVDKEAEAHAREDHGEDDAGGAMDDATQDKRDMEALDDLMGGMGRKEGKGSEKREQELLDDLAGKLAELEKACGL